MPANWGLRPKKSATAVIRVIDSPYTDYVGLQVGPSSKTNWPLRRVSPRPGRPTSSRQTHGQVGLYPGREIAGVRHTELPGAKVGRIPPETRLDIIGQAAIPFEVDDPLSNLPQC